MLNKIPWRIITKIKLISTEPILFKYIKAQDIPKIKPPKRFMNICFEGS